MCELVRAAKWFIYSDDGKIIGLEGLFYYDEAVKMASFDRIDELFRRYGLLESGNCKLFEKLEKTCKVWDSKTTRLGGVWQVKTFEVLWRVLLGFRPNPLSWAMFYTYTRNVSPHFSILGLKKILEPCEDEKSFYFHK